MCPVDWDYIDYARSTRYIKQDWEKLYRAAVLEFDRSRLLQQIEEAEAAILSDREVCQSHLTTIDESRTLSLEPCTS
jgi:hypothetical protein